jgi:hypothetical protein
MADRVEVDDSRGEQALELVGAQPGQALDLAIAPGQAAKAQDGFVQGADRPGG